MKCPSCNCDEVTITWVNHIFHYAPIPKQMEAWVPMHVCSSCSEEWLDHIGEAIIAGVISNYTSVVVIDDEWWLQATLAVRRSNAFSVDQVVTLMKDQKVPIDEMNEWCAHWKWDYPCLFKNNVVEGLG
jgi:hypothetical protein